MAKSFFINVLAFLAFTSESASAQTEWRIPITLETENWTTTVYMAVKPGATDGFDFGLDELAPPPAFNAYAIFYIATFPNYLTCDVRSEVAGAIWNLRTSNCSGKSVTIKWNLSAYLPSEASIPTLELISHGVMARQDSVVRIGDLDLQIKLLSTLMIRQDDSVPQPSSPFLSVYPNPCRHAINVFYPQTVEHPDIKIFDIKGRLVRQLFQGRPPTSGHAIWDGADERGYSVPAGLYFIKLVSDAEVRTVKLMLLK